MHWILIAFGLLDGFLFFHHASWATEAALRFFYDFQVDLLIFIALGHVIIVATLPLTAIGVPLQKKWAFILSYFQLPFRFAYMTFTFGFLSLLIPYLPENMPSKSWFVTGIVAVLELIRMGTTMLAHRRLRHWGTVRSTVALEGVSRATINIIGLLLILAAWIWTYYVLNGRLYTSVHSAIQHNDFPAVKVILSRDQGQLTQLDNYGDAPIHVAVLVAQFTKNTAIVEHLLNLGADINAIDNYGDTPLHNGVQNSEIVQYLINRGAKMNAKNNLNMTPLHYACKVGDAETVKLLVDAGALLGNQDSSGETPLYTAAKLANVEIVEILLQAGAKVHGWARDATDALMAALQQASPFEQEESESTCKRRESIVRLLLSKNITKDYSPQDVDRLFTFAKAYRERCNNSAVLEIFKQHGLKESENNGKK